MSITVPFALFGFLFFGVFVFSKRSPCTAVLIVLITGYLFLPQAEITINGLPEFNRFSSISYTLLIGALLFDWQRIASFKFNRYDLPMLIWCLTPLLTAISNHLGVYEGISGVEGRLTVWLIPYLLGRFYFSEPESIKQFAIAIISMGLIASIMCWFEIRMYPKLHLWIYGFNPTKTHMYVRLGGIRPVLFLRHGIEVGLMMSFCALTALWTWTSGVISVYRGLPMALVSVFLLVTAIFCRSLGALACLAMGLTVFMCTRIGIPRVAMLVMICLPILYVSTRSTGAWYPEILVEKVKEYDELRARSLESRLDSETQTLVRAWKRPLFGWGGYNRYRVLSEKERIVVVDSLWLITFGKYGLLGLVSLGMILLLPCLLIILKLPKQLWLKPSGAPAVVLAVGVMMYTIDCLMNSMLSPIYHVSAGAVIGYTVNRSNLPEDSVI